MKPEIKVFIDKKPLAGTKMNDGCPVECRYCAHHHYLNFASLDAIPEELRGDIPFGVCVRGFAECDREARTVTLKMVTPNDSCWGFHGKHWVRRDLGFHMLPPEGMR